ncbi:MAG TPA: tRNA lysidine(34) synthetase TilS [Phycisphaerales bacterium]|nr:tRNA lysidine(34) synthetase TilS [Phycisphaerales bacterium]
MRPPTLDLRGVQHDRAARGVVRRWRALTGGAAVRDTDRRTLLACSGGADSTALLLALRGAAEELAVAHVVHNMRPEAQTLAERDQVRRLASALGLAFFEGRAGARHLPGNIEAEARRARYRELERLALESGCPFVATAHHAGDQLETVLMALLRGAGPRGLAGIPASRRLGTRGVRLIRPMLDIGRDDAERICAIAGAEWAADPTNADLSRLRAALRAGPAAELRRLRPGALRAVAQAASNQREIAGLLASLAGQVVERGRAGGRAVAWTRAELRDVHPAVIAEAIRLAHARLHGERHADRLPARSLRAAVAAVLSRSGEARRFVWRETELLIEAATVTLQRTADA